MPLCPITYALVGGEEDFDVVSIDVITGLITVETNDPAKAGDAFMIVIQAYNFGETAWAGFFFSIEIDGDCPLANLSDPVVDPTDYTFDVWQSATIPWTQAVSEFNCGDIVYTLKSTADDSPVSLSAFTLTAGSLSIDGTLTDLSYV